MYSNTVNIDKHSTPSTNLKWGFFTALYIILDYTRIYNVFNLGFLRPLMILSLVLIYYIFSSGEYHKAKSKQLSYIWFFIFLLACYIPFARNNYYAFAVAKSQLLYMPFIISVIITINSVDRLKKFILLLISIEIYIALYAFTHSGIGPGNYFLDENDLSLYLNMWLPFCYFLFFAYKRKKNKILCLTGLVLGLLSIVVSFSRGGFLGLIAMAIVLWLFSKKKIVTLFAILFFSGIMFLFAGEKYWAEMSTSINAEEGTGKARIESWKSAWAMFLDKPLGVGGGNFMIHFPEYQTDFFKRGMWGRASHSLWFTLIPELGIIGIYIYFTLIFYNLKDIFRLKNIQFDDRDEDKKFLAYTGRAFIASLAGYFVSGSFISVLYYAHYWYLIGLIVATTKISKNYSNSNLH